MLQQFVHSVNTETVNSIVNSLGYTASHDMKVNPLNAELNPICHLLALVGAHHSLHVSRTRVDLNTKIRKLACHMRLNDHAILLFW